MKPTLYHYWRSSCSWRVRWALNIKGIEYQTTAVNLLKQEHRLADYLEKNPSGQVPTLLTEDGYLAESLSIIEWLEEKHPTPALLPQDARSRQKARQLAYTLTMGVQPLQNLAGLKAVSSKREEQIDYAQKVVKAGFDSYEKQLGAHSGTYSLGSRPTLPDLCLVPQCYNALRFKLRLQDWPTINRIYHHAIENDPACIAAAPHSFEPKV